ncbi:bifunctional UDP-N-acetylglucosamine diphosphorylase/glucosamine-1-phosphate N-acetyltransferase GlmU [Georhizobium sp. MAB10]|uniref:bifunctional UDP-N-acetylglucosamine diphosphorylase/glucosamine-1-phosphate N-acetyltransferase GlmU n=1 Tax=Georhizobium sp. MAB10 TaxID=3028319 RepID=UPI003855C37A
MSGRSCLAVVLAAGEGTRMRSDLPKVLHEVAGLPMVGHVAEAARQAGVDRLAVVVGRGAEAVSAALSTHDVATHLQTERLGTGHAVLAARDTIALGFDDVLVLFGDTPLLSTETIERARSALASGADIAVVGFHAADPTGYGRLIVEGETVSAIREHKDASPEERKITLCNGGVMAISGHRILGWLDRIGNDNAKREYYLTDIVAIAVADGARVNVVEAPAEDLMGANTRVELAELEAAWQRRRRRELMLSGVTMQAPETVFLAYDTAIEPDAFLEPNVVFGPGVTIGAGSVIRAFSHLEGATVAADCEIGPFARLRPGADLSEKAKVGNFCEVKKAKVGKGAKINHLTYIGDAEIGAKSNIGAGTITCNYDGINKHLTSIGAGVFVGSNTSLVAPVAIGDGAYIASGSVITENVSADALALGRARQTEKPGRAADIRARNEAVKAGRSAGK